MNHLTLVDNEYMRKPSYNKSYTCIIICLNLQDALVLEDEHSLNGARCSGLSFEYATSYKCFIMMRNELLEIGTHLPFNNRLLS